MVNELPPLHKHDSEALVDVPPGMDGAAHVGGGRQFESTSIARARRVDT